MKTNLTIEQIAEIFEMKAWKGFRIYDSSVGYNTKKMSTKAYYYISNGELRASVTVDCYNQPEAWCASQAEQFETSMMEWAEGRISERFPEGEIIAEQIESETIVTEEGEVIDLSETVKGYYTEWREVRIAINRYGKLATRNRQFVVICEIAKANAPRNFVQLSEKAYAFASQRNSEIMLEPFAEPIDYEMAVDIAEQMEVRRALDALAAQEAAEQKKIEEASQQEQALVLAQTMENLSGPECLKAWKEAGCPHPAPKMIMDFKNASGLNWKLFTESI